MKTIATILATLMLGTSIAACNLNVDGSFMGKPIKASDTFVTKEYKVNDFDKINLVGSGKVFFTQQPGAPAVSVVTSDNVAELLDVYVENGMLQLKIKKGYSLNNIKKLDYTINAAALKEMNISGSGTIKLMNGLETDKLRLSVTGSGDMMVDNVNCTGDVTVSISGSGDIENSGLQCGDLKVSITGSGDIELKDINAGDVDAHISGSGDILLKGKALKADYSVTGSGDIAADGLLTEEVKARTSGSGDITCYASQAIEANTTGSGSIGYRGNPAKVNISKKGVYSME